MQEVQHIVRAHGRLVHLLANTAISGFFGVAESRDESSRDGDIAPFEIVNE
jgi:hypothetical protein